MAYRVRAFAEAAGVSVKALHHYERLGLLRPGRTAAGYRIYGQREREQLEQILAFKLLGVPLRQIKPLLERPAHSLLDTLRAQRQALEEEHALLGRTIRAIAGAEKAIQSGPPDHVEIFKKIIEVIQMHNSTENAWRALYREANSLLHEDPGSPAAQALGDRWLDLSLRAYRGEAERPAAELNPERAGKFLEDVVVSGRKRYFTAEGWERFTVWRRQATADYLRASQFWQDRVDLFHDIDAARIEPHEIARRWMASLEAESGGDAAIRESLTAAWKDRRNWPATVRWQAEGLTRLTGERFDRAAESIDRALA